MTNLVSAHCVADYFLLQVDQNSGDSLTNLKLQKLIYYGQAWHLAHHGRPMFVERIKAWAHGPVVPDVWHRFKGYKWDALDTSAVRCDPYEDLHSDDLDLLWQVWTIYSPFSGKQLETLTHSEDPWRTAYGDRPPGAKCDVEITHRSMQDFYGKRLLAA
jgi:uncharacterized phage-associated protein